MQFARAYCKEGKRRNAAGGVTWLFREEKKGGARSGRQVCIFHKKSTRGLKGNTFRIIGRYIMFINFNVYYIFNTY